jgi:hypothetical protein
MVAIPAMTALLKDPLESAANTTAMLEALFLKQLW